MHNTLCLHKKVKLKTYICKYHQILKLLNMQSVKRIPTILYPEEFEQCVLMLFY